MTSLVQPDVQGLNFDDPSDRHYTHNKNSSVLALEAELAVHRRESCFSSALDSPISACSAVADPVGRKTMLRHDLAESFLEGERVEWQSFLDGGHMHIRKKSEKPPDAHLGRVLPLLKVTVNTLLIFTLVNTIHLRFIAIHS